MGLLPATLGIGSDGTRWGLLKHLRPLYPAPVAWRLSQLAPRITKNDDDPGGLGHVWLPHDLPKWKTAYHYLWRWRKEGTWAQVHTRLREQLRVVQGREAQPSAGIIDSQSVKTTGVGGNRGYDGAKQIKGRKRHLLVDTQGLVLAVTVHPADVMDRDGVMLLLPPTQIKTEFPRLAHVWLDAGYNGKDKGQDWIEQHLGWTTQVLRPPPRRVLVAEHVEPTPRPAFTALPRRWVVERTFAWLGQNRRLSKDYERACETSETLVYAAMSRLMVRRLTRP